MAGRRVGAWVAEAEVARDWRAVVDDRGGEHIGIGPTGEILVGDGVDLAAESDQGSLAATVMFSSSLSLTCWG